MLWWWMMMMMMMMMMIRDSGLRTVMIRDKIDKYHVFRTCYTPSKSLWVCSALGMGDLNLPVYHCSILPCEKLSINWVKLDHSPRDRDENEKNIFWNHHLDTIYIYVPIAWYWHTLWDPSPRYLEFWSNLERAKTKNLSPWFVDGILELSLQSSPAKSLLLSYCW